MGTVVPVGFADLAFRHVLSGRGDEMICTLGVDIIGTPSDTDWEDLAGFWYDNMVDAQMHSAITFLGMDVRLDTGSIGTFGTPGPGGGAAAIMPPNNSLLVRKRSASGGPKNRGRFYLPSVPEGSVDQSGVIETVFYGGTAVNIAAFEVAMTTHAVVNEIVILHSDPLDTPTVITSLFLDPIIATQRKRLRD